MECEIPSCSIEGLKEGVSYVFKVALRNESGVGEFSEETQPVKMMEFNNLYIYIFFFLSESLLSSFSEITEAKEGKDIELTCTLSDEEAVVNWFKDGKKLSQSNRIMFMISEKIRTLKIIAVNESDSGIYRCETSDSRSKTDGELIVKGNLTSKILSLKLHGIFFEKKLIIYIYFFFQRKKAESVLVHKIKSLVDLVKPLFTDLVIPSTLATISTLHIKTNCCWYVIVKYCSMLKSVVGSRLSLEKLRWAATKCRFRHVTIWKYLGKPSCAPSKPRSTGTSKDSITVEWNSVVGQNIKYIVEIKESKHPWALASKTPLDETSFTITGLKSDSEYLVRVSAVNKAGRGPESEPSDAIKCEQKLLQAKPSFISTPEEIIAIKNSKTKLITEYKGHPSPEVHWYRNKKEIFSGKLQWIETVPGVSTLTIAKMREDDEGNYQIVLKNSLGSVDSEFKLTVAVPPEINHVDRYSSVLVFDKGDTVNLRVSFSGRYILHTNFIEVLASRLGNDREL
uniref:Receptor protein-tyrosine kinase n=1 Tax=Heterorhabditis bacteriophora TaxID=37862 RepID=A0A1I7X1V7_HETBA